MVAWRNGSVTSWRRDVIAPSLRDVTSLAFPFIFHHFLPFPSLFPSCFLHKFRALPLSFQFSLFFLHFFFISSSFSFFLYLFLSLAFSTYTQLNVEQTRRIRNLFKFPGLWRHQGDFPSKILSSLHFVSFILSAFSSLLSSFSLFLFSFSLSSFTNKELNKPEFKIFPSPEKAEYIENSWNFSKSQKVSTYRAELEISFQVPANAEARADRIPEMTPATEREDGSPAKTYKLFVREQESREARKSIWMVWKLDDSQVETQKTFLFSLIFQDLLERYIYLKYLSSADPFALANIFLLDGLRQNWIVGLQLKT